MKPENQVIVDQLKKLGKALNPSNKFIQQSKLRLVQKIKERTCLLKSQDPAQQK